MSAEMPPAIIFDLDDTILSDDAVSDRCWEEVCLKFATTITGLGLNSEALLAEIRGVRRWYWDDPERSRRAGLDLPGARREILTLALGQLGTESPALVGEIVDVYMELKADTVQPFPGALETLEALSQWGIKLALISNGNALEQRAKVRRAGLESLFKSILIGGEFGVPKPDARVFKHTLGQLAVGPDDAWMVGDNLINDIGGAQAVGIYGVWVDWRGGGLPENSTVKPDRIIGSIAELVS